MSSLERSFENVESVLNIMLEKRGDTILFKDILVLLGISQGGREYDIIEFVVLQNSHLWREIDVESGHRPYRAVEKL